MLQKFFTIVYKEAGLEVLLIIFWKYRRYKQVKIQIMLYNI